ncbi:hypothetical protein I3843_07G172500 [Carya illinoinensis]|nr:hypothetical protein I3843_07G172500 [Carya illinoinensis]
MGIFFSFLHGFPFSSEPLSSFFFSSSSCCGRRRGIVHISESRSSSWVRELLAAVIVARERATDSSGPWLLKFLVVALEAL